MKIEKMKDSSLIVTIVLTIIFSPIIWLWNFISLELFPDAFLISEKLATMILYSFVFLSSAILNGICRSILALQRPFWGTISVCGFFLNLVFLLTVSGGGYSTMGLLFSVLFFFLAEILDESIRKALDCLRKKTTTAITCFCFIGIILLMWAISFPLVLIAEYVSNYAWLIGAFVMLGYVCLWGRVYDIAVSYSPKPWLTRLITMSIVLICSFTAYIVIVPMTEKIVSRTCIIIFWTAVGLLLYDLGHFVVGKIQKKTARESQAPLES